MRHNIKAETLCGLEKKDFSAKKKPQYIAHCILHYKKKRRSFDVCLNVQCFVFFLVANLSVKGIYRTKNEKKESGRNNIENRTRKSKKTCRDWEQLENDNACGGHASFASVQIISSMEIHTAKL